MKEGWVVKKLGEVCEIQGGSTPKRTERLFWENGTYPWFTVDDIREQGRVITNTKQKVTLLAWDKLRKFPKDTIMLCCTASVGEYAITKIPITSNQQFNGLVIKDKDLLSPMYLFYYVSTLKHILKNLSGKATIDFVSAEKVRNLQIPIPPLPEQSRIVEELDLLSNIIEKKRQQLSELDNLAQSIFYDMFGEINEFVPLSDYIGALKAGKSLAGDEECVNKVLKTGAVTYDYFDEKQVKNLPQDYTPIIEHKVNSHDLLISRMNTAELVGACAYVWNIDSSTYLPDRLWKAEIKNNANAIYLWKAIVSEKSKEQIRQYASGTSGSMKNISKSSFLKVQIPLVSLSLQQLFAQKIEAIEKQKGLIKQSIAETEELFNSRMDYYFS